MQEREKREKERERERERERENFFIVNLYILFIILRMFWIQSFIIPIAICYLI